ncbi:hypothetical protein [Mesorhizobium sp. M7A.T.Ca.TU.009.02.1.1]|uniref:hypothetical protein n=1 Tax=Mesorhizobium sp. M7A.T.Ca.TU.009.02.1.1 TaxID=2496791 RepID=UPI0019D0F8DC|nr:hypothetical protein [Mesorhizobium sp. M7A.T.Ca.TU.009.02.1.1]
MCAISSINQVRHHQESAELQYSLVDRAVRLGWPPDRVVVIDEDLGKSGNGQVERGGFQRLIAEIGLATRVWWSGSMHLDWRATTGIGINSSSCVHCSALSTPMASASTIPAPITTGHG